MAGLLVAPTSRAPLLGSAEWGAELPDSPGGVAGWGAAAPQSGVNRGEPGSPALGSQWGARLHTLSTPRGEPGSRAEFWGGAGRFGVESYGVGLPRWIPAPPKMPGSTPGKPGSPSRGERPWSGQNFWLSGFLALLPLRYCTSAPAAHAHASGNRGSHQSSAARATHSKFQPHPAAVRPTKRRSPVSRQPEHFVPLARGPSRVARAAASPQRAAPCRRGFGILFCDSFHLYKAVRVYLLSSIGLYLGCTDPTVRLRLYQARSN